MVASMSPIASSSEVSSLLDALDSVVCTTTFAPADASLYGLQLAVVCSWYAPAGDASATTAAIDAPAASTVPRMLLRRVVLIDNFPPGVQPAAPQPVARQYGPRQGEGSASGQEPDDRRGQRGRDGPLHVRPDQERGVGGVAHVAALDQDLRHRGQVEAGQVVAADVAVAAVVVADRQRRGAQQGGVDRS